MGKVVTLTKDTRCCKCLVWMTKGSLANKEAKDGDIKYSHRDCTKS
jgi:hypothetical protein